jgi:DNA modification methylase
MKPYYDDSKIKFYCGDARILSSQIITDNSVDLIFTDPPYPKEYHYCYEWLAKEAERVLKPAGFMIAYAGPYWKDKVMEMLGRRLDYFYDFILVHKGNTSMLWPRKIISGYKSILCYTKRGEKPLPNTNVLGQWDGTGGDKIFHSWGQEETTVRYYIECFSKPNDIVVDYFLGGGTTASVCKRLDRQFIGFEINPDTCEIARNRVKNQCGPDTRKEQYCLPIPS